LLLMAKARSLRTKQAGVRSPYVPVRQWPKPVPEPVPEPAPEESSFQEEAPRPGRPPPIRYRAALPTTEEIDAVTPKFELPKIGGVQGRIRGVIGRLLARPTMRAALTFHEMAYGGRR
jgi:hypothetical protein